MADEEEDYVEPVVINVYTDYFKRDLQLYALGDIRFNKPKSLKVVGYTLVLLVIWSLPMFLLIGPERSFSNVVWAAIILVPPFVAGNFMARPLFHNKPFMKDVLATIRYAGWSAIYADFWGYPYKNDMSMDAELWIADPDCYDDDDRKRKTKRRLFHR